MAVDIEDLSFMLDTRVFAKSLLFLQVPASVQKQFAAPKQLLNPAGTALSPRSVCIAQFAFVRDAEIRSYSHFSPVWRCLCNDPLSQ